MKISVIIPAFNEELYIKKTIESVSVISPFEIIVVDGGSSDSTVEIAKNLGAKVFITHKSRGKQIDEGIKKAEGDIFLIIHSDTRLTSTITREDLILEEGYAGGFFKLKYDGGNFLVKSVEKFANIRSRLHSLPYGDQAIFVKKKYLDLIGGVEESYPFLEDVDMVLKLRKIGKLKCVNKPVLVSPRKLVNGSFFHPLLHSFKNVLIVGLFLLDVHPSRLIKFYR